MINWSKILGSIWPPGFFSARVLDSESHKSVGDCGERIAADFLKRAGYKIIAKGHRNSQSEIDIIAIDRKTRTIVFVEVKAWREAGQGDPSNAVDDRKQRKLTSAAIEFLKRRRLLESPARFDVISVVLNGPNGQPAIRHFENAFEASGRFQMFT